MWTFHNVTRRVVSDLKKNVNYWTKWGGNQSLFTFWRGGGVRRLYLLVVRCLSRVVMLQITALPPAIANLLNRLLVKPPGGIFSLNKPLCVILHLQILAYGYECVCLTQSHAVRLTLLRPFIGDRKVFAYTSNGHFLSTCELVLCCTAIKHCPAWAEMNVAIYYWSFHIKLCCTGINTGRSLTGLKVRNCKL